MAEVSAAVLRQIIADITPLANIRSATRLDGGSSTDMYLVETDGEGSIPRALVVRFPGGDKVARSPHAARREAAVLRFAARAGLPVPAVLAVDDSPARVGRPYLAIEYIEGRPIYAARPGESVLARSAATLAAIHHVKAEGADHALLEETISLGRRTEQSSIEVLVPADFRRTVEADTNGRLPVGARNAGCFVHGDYWPGNLLWRNDDLVAVVDWEDAGVGDPLPELSIARLDAAWIFGLEAMESFTAAYRVNSSLDWTDLPLWDLWAVRRLARLAALFLGTWLDYFARFGRPDLTAEVVRRRVGQFVTATLKDLS